jgi:hypothetical protein
MVSMVSDVHKNRRLSLLTLTVTKSVINNVGFRKTLLLNDHKHFDEAEKVCHILVILLKTKTSIIHSSVTGSTLKVIRVMAR